MIFEGAGIITTWTILWKVDNNYVKSGQYATQTSFASDDNAFILVDLTIIMFQSYEMQMGDFDP